MRVRSSGLLAAMLVFIILFCSVLSLPHAALSVSVNGGNLQLDFDGAGGYEGDYVVIYNPSMESGASLSSGSLTGKLASSFTTHSRADSALEKQRVDFAPPQSATPSKIIPKDRPNRRDLFSTQNYEEGNTRTFQVLESMLDEKLISRSFTLLHKGTRCYVWAIPSDQYTITSQMARDIALEYDNRISPNMAENFGAYYNPENSGRLNILVYDLVDHFGTSSNQYYGGYFWSLDLVDPDYGGNGAAMIHIDTYPTIHYKGESSLDEAMSTMVHELQHLINFSQYVLQYMVNPPLPDYSWMETWLDETCSMAAEELVYPGSVLPRRIQYLTQNDSEYTSGASQYWWDDVLENYAMNCLFGQYIRRQTGSYAAFKTMLGVFRNDPVPSEAKAVEAAVQGSALHGMSLSDIVLSFRIALIANDADNYNGIYGFRGSADYDAVPKMLYTSSSPANIYGGGAIVIQPKDSVFVPPSNAAPGLVFVGISLDKPASSLIVDHANKTISNINPNTAPAAFSDELNLLFPGASVSINGVGPSGYVGTGCTAQVNGGALETYTVILYGDVDGTGTIGAPDAMAVMNHLIGVKRLEGAYLAAADATRDLGVNIGDATAILSFVNGVDSIVQS